MSTHVIPVNRTVQIERQIVVIACASCFVDFGIGADFQKRRRDDHENFYCPNGHPNHYPVGTSESKKKAKQLERELEAARALAARESRRRANAEADARHKDYAARAAKGQLTKTRKRIAAGVCPCCNRTFVNLGRHMAGQHPEFTAGGES